MSSLVVLAIILPLVALAVLGAFLAYVWVRYAHIVERIFQETPVFAPLRAAPEPGGEEVTFTTEDGLTLAGTYYPAKTPRRTGVIAFCPEFLGERATLSHYGDGLREAGFDLFTFDFRNHGDSQTDPTYNPLQWVSDIELRDLRAALTYLRSRPDADPAGVGLFGISRGGGTALCLAAEDPGVWAVVTDGAFPTHGTMEAYIRRWAEIYVLSKWLLWTLPYGVYAFAGWAGRYLTARRNGRRYPKLERAVAQLSPRPWLLIHGEKDVYIGPEIALKLFERAGEPKESWIVPGAKHNRCREANPDGYRLRVVDFFSRHAPRRVRVAGAEPAADGPDPLRVPSARAPRLEPAALASEGAPAAFGGALMSLKPDLTRPRDSD